MSLPFETQMAYTMHMQEHEQAMMQKQQAQMMQAMASGQAPMPQGQEPNPMKGSQPVHGGAGAKPHDKFIQGMMKDTNGSLTG